MSVYDVWQQEIYAGVTGMTDSQLYQVPENETTVSHLVDVAIPQHTFWKYLNGHIPVDLIWSCFVFLFYFLLILCLLATMLNKCPAQNVPEQDNDNVPEQDNDARGSNEDLASENARLAKENTQLAKDLIQAQEDASMWEGSYHEERGRRQPDSTRWRRMYHETYDENTRLREEYARTRAQDAKIVTERARIERKKEVEKAKRMADLQTKLDLWNRQIGQLEGHNERLKQKLWDQTQAINNVETTIAAKVKIQDEQYATIMSLKSEKIRHARRITELEFKLSTSETHQDAAIMAAVKAATAKSSGEHSRSIIRLKKHRGVMMPEARRLLAETGIVKGVQSGAVSKPKRSIIAGKSKKAVALSKALFDLRGMQSQEERSAADLTRALSDLNRMQSEKEKIETDLTTTSSDLSQMQSEKGDIAADLTTALSDLNRTQSEKEKIAADLTKASSDLKQLQSEKEKIAADSTKSSSDLSETQSEKEKIAVDLTKAISDLNEMQSGNDKIAADLKTTKAELETKVTLAEHLQQEIQALRSHVCDHTHCQQQLQTQVADTTEALRLWKEACSTLRESNNAHENTKADLSSIKRDVETLKGVHSQCDQATKPQDKMDVVEPADELTEVDEMDVDTPQQILIDRLELAQQKIGELKVQNEKLLEVMKGSRDSIDVLGYSPSAAMEDRIREKVLSESKEERGALLRRVEEQKDEIKKKDEALKNNNVSQRLQDELKAAKEKASKLEYDLSTLRQDSKSKPSGASTAPTQNRSGQTGPSSPGPSANETIQRLKFDLKRLNKETKDARANYDRVDKVLFKRDQKACEDLRNVEKVRAELGAEIERLQKKIERLEAGVGEQPPASSTTAPGPSGQEGVSAGGKRAWDGEGDEEAGREAVKKLKE